jgi:transcriptional regulator with XRE-family HTH domain
MDAITVGATFRMVRVRRKWRQRDVARRAGVSDGVVSRIEHGQLASITFGAFTRVADALEIRYDHRLRWRAADLDRMAGQDHAALVESMASRLVGAGWTARPEVSFALWGDRGAVDLLAWRDDPRVLLVVEVKTEIVDVGECLRVLGMKRRRAIEIGAVAGRPDPGLVCVALLVADTRTNHRRVAAHAETFRSALPDTGRDLARCIAGVAAGPVAALAYMPYPRVSTTRPRTSGVQRVRAPRTGARKAA